MSIKALNEASAPVDAKSAEPAKAGGLLKSGQLLVNLKHKLQPKA